MPPKDSSQRQTPFPRWCHFLLIKFQLAIAAIILVGSSFCHAVETVTLAWDPNPESNIATYIVYCRTSDRLVQSFPVGNVTSAKVEGLDDATEYFFTVTAKNLEGLESEPSNEVSYTTPAQQEEAYWLTVISGEGSGPYHYGDEVLVTARPLEPGQQFAGWEGDRDILADFMSMETTARIVRMEDLTITATYSNLPKYNLTVVNGTISGEYYANEEVEVTANAAPAGQQFASWTGNVVFANPMSPRTTLTMPAYAVSVTATYTMSDRIRYYPRSGYRSRMVGGVFEGTNDPAQGYVELHKINTTPAQAWTSVNVNLGNYRYLRYRAPNGSYGNVAEIEFRRGGVKLTGTSYGSSGSWQNQGNTFRRAVDGNINTYFDGPTANGNYVGIDRGNP